MMYTGVQKEHYLNQSCMWEANDMCLVLIDGTVRIPINSYQPERSVGKNVKKNIKKT